MAEATPRVRALRSPETVRARCERLFSMAVAGELAGFTVHMDRMEAVADRVAAVTRAAYPTLEVPFHSRLRHFDAGGVPRLEGLSAALAGERLEERARAKIDLVVTSVLLDAGAGPSWRYREAQSGQVFSRSEGLAVASFRMFEGGAFSSHRSRPLRADAAALASLEEETVARGFQVGPDNPLEGLTGRVALLRGLGAALESAPDLFGESEPRPGGLVPFLRSRVETALSARPGAVRIDAPDVLHALLRGMGAIWPGRVTFEGHNLGDVWPHRALGPEGSFESLVPFHKLSQWLAYSLVEPLEEAGFEVARIDELTGLPEYRNGGLFLDGGVLEARDPAVFSARHAPGSELIVEWRALTVALLDRLAPLVRSRLGKSAAEMPLARILEGGTWAAGRAIAAERRLGGPPPLTLESDGTVF